MQNSSATGSGPGNADPDVISTASESSNVDELSGAFVVVYDVLHIAALIIGSCVAAFVVWRLTAVLRDRCARNKSSTYVEGQHPGPGHGHKSVCWQIDQVFNVQVQVLVCFYCRDVWNDRVD